MRCFYESDRPVVATIGHDARWLGTPRHCLIKAIRTTRLASVEPGRSRGLENSPLREPNTDETSHLKARVVARFHKRHGPMTDRDAESLVVRSTIAVQVNWR